MAINTNISGIKLDSATDDNKIPVYDAASNSFLMETPSAGSGDVTKVGTPVDNQVGVWTGDGTIEGDVDLTFDTSTNTLGVGLVGLDGRVQVHAVKSDASDGLLIEAANGTDVGLLGVGNTANATWNGSHNFEGGQVAVGKSSTTLGKLKLYGNTSGDVTIQPNAVAGTGVVLTAPATTGTIALTSDIPAAGANTDLSNLAGVAINTSLVSDTDNTDDLGTTLKKWANLFVTTIGATATRVTKGWFTDLEVTNAITGSITGNAATVTTNANLTGDVTSTGNATTIANSAVTLAKMANLAQDQFIGRTTASTGVPETATITAAARTVLDDTTVGAMVDTLGGATSTGTGGLVRATSPTFVTPALGTPTSGVLTNCTGLPTAGLVDDAVTLAKMASGTAGNIITYDASGNPAAVATGTAGQVLTSNGAGAAPTFQAVAGGGNPGFDFVSYNTATATGINVTGLDLDTDICYKVIVKADNGSSNTTSLLLKFNATTGGYGKCRWGINSSGASFGARTTGNNDIEISENGTENHYAEFIVMRRETSTDFIMCQGQAHGTNGGNDAIEYALNFAGTAGDSNNMTQINFAGGHSSTGWKVWVFKAATS